MSRIKLPIERDPKMEKLSGIQVTRCTAYYESEGFIKIIGEVASLFERTITDYKEIHVIMYDRDGDILFRTYTNWVEFGIRQSYELEGQSENPSSYPVKIVVFPSNG